MVSETVILAMLNIAIGVLILVLVEDGFWEKMKKNIRKQMFQS